MPHNHERKGHDPGGERQPVVVSYSLAASFHTREEGQEPHNQVKQIIKQDNDLDLSSFLFERKPHDPQQPPLERPWFLAVIGDTPPEPVQQQFQEILRTGELTQLSLETIVTLAQRRAQEGRPGRYRESQHGQEGVRIPEATVKLRRNKDKLKRKAQDKSRRRNRGT